MNRDQVSCGMRSVLYRELDLISHNLGIFAVIILSPLFFALFYGSVYVNKKEAEVSVVVVDHDCSKTSRAMVRNLDSHQMIAVEYVLSDIAVAERKLLESEVQAVIFIPSGFCTSFAKHEGIDVRVNLNASRFLVANDVIRAINEVAGTIGAAARIRFYESQGYSSDQSRRLVVPLRTDLRTPFNVSESYGDFLLPGVFVIILQQTLLMGLSQSVANEREQRKIRNLLKSAKGSFWSAICGKALFYVLLFAAYALFFYVVLFELFKLPISGSISALALTSTLFLVAVTSLCLFAASFIRSQLAALQICILSSYPFFLLSGFTWPTSSMPWLLKARSQFIPSTPYLTAVGRITQMGAGWPHVWSQLLHLLILATVGLVAVRFRWKHLFRIAVGE